MEGLSKANVRYRLLINWKHHLIAILLFSATLNVSGQTTNDSTGGSTKQTLRLSYAYIKIEHRAFSNKLTVFVDLGNTEEQLKEAKLFTDSLNGITSLAAVMNFMSEHGYEYVSSHALVVTAQGTGGTSGLYLIMRKPRQ